MRVVQELLGHASVTTTQIYTLVTVDNLREVFAAAHPRRASERRPSHFEPWAYPVWPTSLPIASRRSHRTPIVAAPGGTARPSLTSVGDAGSTRILSGVPLRKIRRDATSGAFSAFRVSEWSVRRKVVAVLAIPVILAAVFGGLRVSTELSDANAYSTNKQQATVLGPAIAYLSADPASRAPVGPVGQDE